MIISPVIIPTLNRIEHLQRCISSLAQNDLANQTDLFISVDYPPSEKYIEGHSKICEYLQREFKEFKSVNVIFQKENLGAYNNYIFLQKIITEKYDRYIYTEDDNIFSANFLSYMNGVLDMVASRDEVIAVNGYSQNINWHKKNQSIRLAMNEFNAWGYGMMTVDAERIYKYITSGELKKELKSFRALSRIMWKRPDLFLSILRYFCGKRVPFVKDDDFLQIDMTITFYNILNGKLCAMPTVTKVNNIGYDGSGEHCANINYEQMELDKNPFWPPIDDVLIYDRRNDCQLKIYFMKQKILNKLFQR